MSYSTDVGNKQVLRDLTTSEDTKLPTGLFIQNKKMRKVSEPTSIVKKMKVTLGNLSPKMVRHNSTSAEDFEKAVIIPNMATNMTEINIGDILDCVIRQDIMGYVGSVSPIRAIVRSGRFKGYTFIGNATMDPNTKKVIVEFSKFSTSDGSSTHQVKASVLETSGEVGLEGSHTSYYWQYFFASVLSRAAQGYAEATQQRDQNILGNYVVQPNLENAGKNAAVEGAAATAELFTEKIKQAPEYTRVRGPVFAKIFILEEPNTIKRR